MPKSTERCSTNMSHSSKVLSSSSSSMRSRAVSLPLACCASMRFFPPPRRAWARRFSSCSISSCMVCFRSCGPEFRVLSWLGGDGGRREQLACRRRCRQRALCHLLRELRQQLAHLRVLPECLVEPGGDALPHPRRCLLLAALGELAIGGLQLPDLRDGVPESVDARTRQRAQLQHLGQPEANLGAAVRVMHRMGMVRVALV